ncbi:TPA: hypothetical protein ACH3X2_012388 [Trebouxia sp. C0005]
MTSQSAAQAEAGPGHNTTVQDMQHKVCVFCGFKRVEGSPVSAQYPTDSVNNVVNWFMNECTDPVLLKKHSPDTLEEIIKSFELAFPKPFMLQQDIVSRFRVNCKQARQ